MSTIEGVLVASHEPARLAAGIVGAHVVRWPDDGPRLVESHWDTLGPLVDSLAEKTGVRRIGADEAVALPGVSTIAAMLALRGGGVLVADPASLIALLSTISNLTYAQRRLLPMPLDILASMNRQLGAVAALAGALPLSGEVLGMLRDRGRWVAVVQADGELGARARRHLELTGIAVVDSDPMDVFAGRVAVPEEPWLDVRRDGDEYELLVRVGGVGKDSMTLARAGDDLIVTVDGAAHPITLPSGLRRCVVIGGSVRDDGVRIRFRPDEGAWRG